MHTIEVDFEVLKALMAKRCTETVTNNDVIRDLLELKPKQVRELSKPSAADWIVKGVRFPEGTEFRGKADRSVIGRVQNGGLIINGTKYASPSAAAVAMTGYAVNGWIFWECRMPGGDWRRADSLRQGK